MKRRTPILFSIVGFVLIVLAGAAWWFTSERARFYENVRSMGDEGFEVVVRDDYATVRRIGLDTPPPHWNARFEIPIQLGLPALGSARIAAPAPWSQAAGAYAQLAQESPWYFAFMQAQQTEGTTDIDEIIDTGEDLAAAAAAGRDHDLFDALFDGYRDALADVGDYVFGPVRRDVLAAAGLPVEANPAHGPSIDPWGGLGQNVNQHAPSFTRLDGQSGLQDFVLSSGANPGNWNVFGPTNVPGLTSVFVEQDTPGAVHTYTVSVTANGFAVDNDLLVRFEYTGSGQSFDRRSRRVMVWRLYSFGSPIQISSDNAAQNIFDEDPQFWPLIRHHFMNGQLLSGTSIFTTNTFNDQVRIDITHDVLAESLDPSASYVESRLEALQDDVWTAAIADDGAETFASPMYGHESLIEAYVTLSMPELFELSTVTRAGLRGDASTGELSLSRPIDDIFASQLGNGDDGVFDIGATMDDRIDAVQSDITAAIDNPAGGQSFIDWTLAELRDTRDNAFRLAVDDTYRAGGPGTLSVPAASGVMANDVDQEFRTIEVDTDFVNDPAYVAPEHGVVVINPDGSFTYTPDPGFTGTDSFTYRTFTTVTPTSPEVYSDPATVVILVTEGECPVDFDGNGLLDLSDVVAFVTLFQADDPLVDFDGSGLLDLNDIVTFITLFQAGCP